MRHPFPQNAAGAALIFLVAAGPAVVRADALLGIHDRPGTPTNMKVAINHARRVIEVSWTNTASAGECVSFEFSTKLDGELLPRDSPENPMGRAFPGPEDNAGEENPYKRSCVKTPGGYGRTFEPYRFSDGETCFQAWARAHPSGVRSDNPSNWGCIRIPLDPPRAPQAVRARVPSVASTKPPTVSWRSEVGGWWPRITRFTIERQSPAGATGPWTVDGTLPGTNEPRNVLTTRDFSFGTRPVDLQGTHAYRVCSENAGGRTCSEPVRLETAVDALGGTLLNSRASVGVAASRTSPSPAETTAGVQNSVVPQALAPAKPSSPAAASVRARNAAVPAASVSGAGGAAVSGMGAASIAAAPAANAARASAPAAAVAPVRDADLPAGLSRLDDSAIVTVGGKQMRAGEVKQEVLKLNDDTMLKVGGQPVRASSLKQELNRSARPINWGDVPGSKTALNPQPLPPKSAMPSTHAQQLNVPASAFQQQ